jgi:D-inositol-3-phosphate glycosyltransferase
LNFLGLEIMNAQVFTEERIPEVLGSAVESGTTAEAIEAAVLTGCQDRPYAYGLAMALVAKGVRVELIGSDEIDSPELHRTPLLRFINLRGQLKQYDGPVKKLSSFAAYYIRLIGYTLRSKPKILHILWNNKFEYIDRTLLMMYYKLCGKKISLTAHNVNQAKRDQKDSLLNRLTLKIQYRLTDHIFVHTRRMKDELCEEFGVAESAVTVIRHPVNDAFPDTDLTPSQAKEQLGLAADEKAVLFLGRLRPYKGIEHLLAAFEQLVSAESGYRLIIAGAPNKGNEDYVDQIREMVSKDFRESQIITRIKFIPDEEMELYLKAADVMVLPYKDIFQSGILFLSYSFGLPVVATDVGSFRDEVVEGETGFICRPGDPADMAATLKKYFASDLYRNLGTRRDELKDYANRVHSWQAVAELTQNAFFGMTRKSQRLAAGKK